MYYIYTINMKNTIMKNLKNKSKQNIYSIDGCNVYIEERDENNFFIDLWEAPVMIDGSIDHTMWGIIEDQEIIDNYFDSDKVKVSSITTKRFITILTKDYADWFYDWDKVIPELKELHEKTYPLNKFPYLNNN